MDENNRRKQFRLWLSPAERELLEQKAELYGYKCLSYYLRDAALYESVIQIIPTGIEELLKEYNEYLTEMKKITKEVRRILKYDTHMSDDEKELLQHSLYKVYSQTKSLKKTTKEKVDYNILEKKGRAKRNLFEISDLEGLEAKISQLQLAHQKYQEIEQELNKYIEGEN